MPLPENGIVVLVASFIAGGSTVVGSMSSCYRMSDGMKAEKVCRKLWRIGARSNGGNEKPHQRRGFFDVPANPIREDRKGRVYKENQ